MTPFISVTPRTCTLTVKGWKLENSELRKGSITAQLLKEGPREMKHLMHQAQDSIFIT